MFQSIRRFLVRANAPKTTATAGEAPRNLLAPVVPATRAVSPPIRQQGGGYTWGLEAIVSARTAQLRGDFCQPVRLAEAFRTNDALFTAYQTRVSTQSSVQLLWSPVDSDAGREAALRAERAIDIPQCARESILGTLANHGIAIGYVERTTVDDAEYGPTIQMCLTEWPLEHVRYNPSSCTLETRTRESGTVTITHGDGRWIVFRKFGLAPWTQDACVLPGALLWAAHGSGISDWAGASSSHGQPKVLGTLREGITLGDGENLHPEAKALLDVLTQLVGGEATAGVLPAGSTAELLYNGSTAWQVFRELILNREKAAMRIYLGTDAVLGAQGGAPGVDIAALFNVASTRIQGDFEALERGFREGMIVPWAQLHAIAHSDMPTRTYAMPDTDGEQRSVQEGAAIDRLGAAVKVMKDSGLDVTQDTINALVSVLGVSVPCALAAVETHTIPLQLAPTDAAKVVRVREARASQGLEPLGDERDDMTIPELDAATKAASAPPAEDPAGGGATDATDAPNADLPAAYTPSAMRVRRTKRLRVSAAAKDGDGESDDGESDDGEKTDKTEPNVAPEDYDWRKGLADVQHIREEPIDGDGDGKLNEEEHDIERQRQKFLKRYDRFAAKQKKADASIAELATQRKAASKEADEAASESEKLLDSRDTPEGEKKYQETRKREAKALSTIDRLDDKAESIRARADNTDQVSSAFEDYSLEISRAAAKAEEVRDDLKDRLDKNPDESELKRAVAEAEEKYSSKQERSDAITPLEEKLRDTPDREVIPADVHEVAGAIVTGPKGGRYRISDSGKKVYV